MLEGVNWRHFPNPNGSNKVLAIFYSPVQVRYPILPYFKKTANLPCGRLLISPFTDEFFQDCLQSTQDVISTVSSKYERTIHYGYSMGAYASLRFGSVDVKSQAVFAMSPHFVLDRAFSRSNRLMTMAPSLGDNDVRPFIEAARGMRFFIAISCLDVMDGIQHSDASSLYNPLIECHAVLEPHDLPGINDANQVVGDFIKLGTFPKIDSDHRASETDILDCISAYKYMKASRSGEIIESIDDNHEARVPQLHYWKARYMAERGHKLESLQWFVKGLESAKKFSTPLAEILISYGNTLADLGFHEPALGCYRHFRKQNPPVKISFLCEASLLRRLGRQKEVLELAIYYEDTFGADETSAKIRGNII